jgi:CubicO group peptidase (beta-lactamase class C family)
LEDAADLSNWRVRPHSRWAFRNVPKIIDCAVVANDPSDVWTLERTSKLARGSLAQRIVLQATATDAIVVLIDGKIVFESYDHGNEEHTPHILMSATKSVVGLVLGILSSKGAIDLEAPVTQYVPEVGKTAYRAATIRQLMDMRSGVELTESEERACRIAAGWDPVPDGEAPQSLHDWFTHLAVPVAPAGGPFRYISANTDLLGWAVERATGATFASLVSDLLWKPMGAEQDAYLTLDREGSPRCTGGLCATARDFARIGQLLVDDGRRGSREIVPPAVIDDIATSGDAEAWRTGQWGKAFAPISKNMNYRSGWYVINDDPQLLFAMGIHGQNLFVDRRNRIVIAKLSSWSQSTDYIALPLTHLTIDRLRRSIVKKRARTAVGAVRP